MLCGQCEIMLSRLSLTYQPQVHVSGLAKSLSTLFCARCGALQPPADPERLLRRKGSQLSRFGLGADDEHVLAAPPLRKC